VKPDVKEWLKSGEYLPDELRDFHAQKLFFKWLVWKQMGGEGELKSPYLQGLNFVMLQVAVIDYFLWFMGAFGYKLQRTRKKGVEFYNLPETMKAYDNELMEQSRAQFEQWAAERKAQAEEGGEG